MKPKLTLVGAGPGDPELISLKGMRALNMADVVLYDALAHPDLLDHCKKNAVKVFVGKRAGMHSYQQEQINQLIVDYALSGNHVVRLKGGDPFIFGRGREEIEYAEALGIETDAIPGISSINLPGYYGISLTHRGINESFWVITSVTSKGTLSEDVKLAAKTNATVVLLMGLKKLNEIVSVFREAGKDELPVAVISKGSLPEGSVLIGKVNDVAHKVKESRLQAPALIVLGEVVGPGSEFRKEARWLGAELLNTDG
ncbi:MAG: uroporphyrinogen-III C-methyltransferase [Cyclobacteriaceae bacterium]|nr:MAG: uroporphyrinogen-III C-methyltransferase [Cyclobacteriaceae bacterium]